MNKYIIKKDLIYLINGIYSFDKVSSGRRCFVNGNTDNLTVLMLPEEFNDNVFTFNNFQKKVLYKLFSLFYSNVLTEETLIDEIPLNYNLIKKDCIKNGNSNSLIKDFLTLLNDIKVVSRTQGNINFIGNLFTTDFSTKTITINNDLIGFMFDSEIEPVSKIETIILKPWKQIKKHFIFYNDINENTSLETEINLFFSHNTANNYRKKEPSVSLRISTLLQKNVLTGFNNRANKTRDLTKLINQLEELKEKDVFIDYCFKTGNEKVEGFNGIPFIKADKSIDFSLLNKRGKELKLVFYREKPREYKSRVA